MERNADPPRDWEGKKAYDNFGGGAFRLSKMQCGISWLAFEASVLARGVLNTAKVLLLLPAIVQVRRAVLARGLQGIILAKVMTEGLPPHALPLTGCRATISLKRNGGLAGSSSLLDKRLAQKTNLSENSKERH